ncbi:MAG: kinase [Proteobacteria bacterium]|nr:kinase [Pseudomonadota bacterium]
MTSTSPRPCGFPEPFVANVLDDALAHGARVLGIAGLQGSGKSTLAAQVVGLAATRDLHAIALSIDDFYLGRRERLALGRRVHPLLATRGPPGTHNVQLACGTLDALRAGRPTALPRFDKLGDRRLPPSRWHHVAHVPDLIVFEGWFLKTPAELPADLHEPVNALERDADPLGRWRAWCNQALRTYTPLWQRIDRLLFLQAPGFEIVPDWRWQQEQAMHATQPRRRAMDRHAVERFVMAFERVSRQALRTLPTIAERTLPIDAQHRPIAAAIPPANG